LQTLKRWRIGLLGILVSVAAAYFVLSQVNLSELGDAFGRVRWGWFVLCMLLLVLGLLTRAWRWRVLLSGGLPVWRAFSIMNVAYLVNGLLPLRAGEVARAFLATRATPPVPVMKSVSTIIVERLLDLLAVMLLVVLALASGPLPDELRAAATVLAPLALVGFLVLVGLSARRSLVTRLMNALVARLPVLARWRIPQLADHFLDGLTPLAQPKALLLALFTTAISWALSVAAGYVLMLTLYEQADFATTCLFIAAASLATAAPAVPGNVGTYELSILLALRATGYGEPASTASAFAILVHASNLLVYAILGVLGFIQEGISLGQLSQGVRDMQRSSNAGLNKSYVE
jgi:uncharacterized protein (TIRG00374 family)